MNISDDQIRSIVQNVVKNVVSNGGSTQAGVPRTKGDFGVFDDVNDAIAAAKRAFEEFRRFDLQDRKRVTDELRRVAMDHREELSRMVFDETKMGRYDHKVMKHIGAAVHTSGIDDIDTKAWSGKNGLCVEEYAPYGVIGAVTPSTHPSETLINNAIMMLSAGNTVFFATHPGAKKVSSYALKLCNQYMIKAGAPENLITTVTEPTIESANTMFHHKDIKLLSITGGPGVVKAAMKANKRVIAAGPGNPPALVDETADIERAAERITKSASFDNNILCTAEKQIFVVESVFQQFMLAMQKQGNVKVSTNQMDDLARKILTKSGEHFVPSRDYVGRNASVCAKAIGMTHVSDDVPLIYGETDRKHPWVVAEQMLPVIPVIRVKNFEEGVRQAIESEHGFGHSASVHTRDMERATYFSKLANVSICVVNGGTFQGDGGDEGQGTFSYTIATPTGESVTRARDFARIRRIMTAGSLRFV